MQDAGILDANGKMVDLDLRENGESVSLAALTTRIVNGETVGNITVNGKETTPEQVMKISQVSAALEIAELLDTEIDVTDAHVKNLETLLTGIQNGTIDVQSTLQTGSLRLSPASTTALRGTAEPEGSTEDPDYYFNQNEYGGMNYLYKFNTAFLPSGHHQQVPGLLYMPGQPGEERIGYYGHYFDEEEYDPYYVFPFTEPEEYTDYGKVYYYMDDCYCGVNAGNVNITGVQEYIDWDNVKWGVDGNATARTVTILLPVKTDPSLTTEISQWVSNAAMDFTGQSGGSIRMTLPGYGEKTIQFAQWSMRLK